MVAFNNEDGHPMPPVLNNGRIVYPGTSMACNHFPRKQGINLSPGNMISYNNAVTID